jgi:hypothetical protein
MQPSYLLVTRLFAMWSTSWFNMSPVYGHIICSVTIIYMSTGRQIYKFQHIDWLKRLDDTMSLTIYTWRITVHMEILVIQKHWSCRRRSISGVRLIMWAKLVTLLIGE